MRMRETWLALSRSTKTVMFSSASAPISLPPRDTVYDGLLVLKVGSRDKIEADDLWFSVSQESMTPDSGAR